MADGMVGGRARACNFGLAVASLLPLVIGGCGGALLVAPLGGVMLDDAATGRAAETRPGPRSQRLAAGAIADNIDGNTVLVEWYRGGRIGRLECGLFASDGAYRAVNFVADAARYDADSAVRRRGVWTVRPDRLCVNAEGWGCFAVEADARRLRLVSEDAVVANLMIYDGAREFEQARCGL